MEQPNTWANIGGAIDSNEVPLEASIREAFEEVRLKEKILKSHLLFVFTKGSFKYFNYLHEIEKEFTHILNNESSDYKWVTRDTLFKLLNANDTHFGLKACLNTKKAQDVINGL